MTNDELMSKTVSYLRFPLTVIVVMAHFNLAVLGFSIHGVTYGLNQPAWYYWIISFFSGKLIGLGVPLFYMIAGYLFFYKKGFSLSIYKQKLKSRLHTLLIPYLLWNTLAIVLVAIRFLPVFSSILPGMDNIRLNLSFSGLIHTYYDNFHQEGLFIYPEASSKLTIMPIDGPLWFVRDLMVMVVVSPILYWLIKQLKAYAVLLWAVVIFVFVPLFMEGGYFASLLSSTFYFLWGAYYSITQKNLVVEMRRFKYVPYLYVPILLADTVTTGTVGSILHYGGVPLGAIAAIVVTSYLMEAGKIRLNKLLSESSFFVFAMHMLIMWEVAKVVFVLLHIPDNPFALLAFYFFIVTITILICLGSYVLLKKYMPSVCKLLTGGR